MTECSGNNDQEIELGQKGLEQHRIFRISRDLNKTPDRTIRHLKLRHPSPTNTRQQESTPPNSNHATSHDQIS